MYSIDNIRHMFENDVRFLEQFKSVNDILLFLTFATVLIGLWLLIRGVGYSLKYFEVRARGVTLGPFGRNSRCSRCDRSIPFFSRRRSVRELVFGGWTCPKCGSEIDQLGIVRLARARDEHLRDFSKRDRVKQIVEEAKDGRSPIERVIDE